MKRLIIRWVPLCFLLGLTAKAFAEPQWREGYQVYRPNVVTHTIFTGESHDASIVFFDGKWLAMWDSGTEKDGQVIWQSTSADLVTWSRPILSFSSSEGSDIPILSTTTRLQWQPSLLVVDAELWCLWYASAEGLYLSKLKSITSKWSNKLIFGRPGIVFDNKPWSIFATNGGVRMSDGTIVFPVTLMREGDFFKSEKRDSIIYTKDKITWNVSRGVSFGPTGSQAWEATVWEPVPGQLNLISRNNRDGREDKTQLLPQENLKFTKTLLSNLDVWVPETYVPIEAAMSRPHVVRKGERNFLAQNDSHLSSTEGGANRKNLSLFFNRGKGADFVGGLTLFPYTAFTNSPPHTDYPQMAVHGNRGVVIFSHRPETRTDWSVKVSVVDALPADNARYLFPRTARGRIEQDTTGERNWVRFLDNYSSAGIDIDENNPASDTVLLKFRFKAETDHRQIITSFGYPSVSLVVENGRLFLGKLGELSSFIDCGGINRNDFNGIEFESGLGKTSVRLNNGAQTTLPYSPGEGRAMYFGLNFYGGVNAVAGAAFVVDLNSVKTAVVQGLPPTAPALNSSANGSSIGFSWESGGGAVSGFEVDIWTNITSKFVSGWQTKDVGMTRSVTLEGLRGGATYYARVRAYDADGTRSSWSPTREQRVMGLVNLDFERPNVGDGMPGWATSDDINVKVTNEGNAGTQGLKILSPLSMAWQDWGGYMNGTTYQLSFWGRVESAEGLTQLPQLRWQNC